MRKKITKIVAFIFIISCSSLLNCIRDDYLGNDFDLLKKIFAHNSKANREMMYSLIEHYQIADADIKKALTFENSKLDRLIASGIDTLKVKPISFEEFGVDDVQMYYHNINDPGSYIMYFYIHLLEIRKNVLSRGKESNESLESLLSEYFKVNLVPYRYFFFNLAKMKEYEVIEEELERFRIIAIALRKKQNDEIYSSENINLQIIKEFNFYNIMKCYTLRRLGKFPEMYSYYFKTQFEPKDEVVNGGMFGFFFALMQLQFKKAQFPHDFLIDEFLTSWLYYGPDRTIESRLLRKTINTENCITKLVKDLDESYNKKKTYFQNYERMFMHLAYLNYSINNEEEAMKWFKRALTDFSTFTGDWDYWLDYRFYEKGEKEALLELKEKYLKEQKK